MFYRVFIDDLKEVQKLRRRQHGISLDDLSAVPTTERPANVKVTIFMSTIAFYICSVCGKNVDLGSIIALFFVERSLQDGNWRIYRHEENERVRNT